MQVFVSEETCIGCKNCTHVCPQTFAIEDDYGRARAMHQGKGVMDAKPFIWLTQSVPLWLESCVQIFMTA